MSRSTKYRCPWSVSKIVGKYTISRILYTNGYTFFKFSWLGKICLMILILKYILFFSVKLSAFPMFYLSHHLFVMRSVDLYSFFFLFLIQLFQLYLPFLKSLSFPHFFQRSLRFHHRLLIPTVFFHHLFLWDFKINGNNRRVKEHFLLFY